MNAKRLFKAIEEFRKLNGEMQAQCMSLFLLVGMHKDSRGISMTDLKAKLGVAQSSVSRNVSILSKIKIAAQPGFGLVEAIEDPMERMRKLVRLTNKGNRVYKSLTEQ